MKNKVFTAIACVTALLPWTILIFRSFEWALLSPTAEIMIAVYALFMIAGGAFAIVAFAALKVRNTLMGVCLVVNSLYLMGGIVALCMMLPTVLA